MRTVASLENTKKISWKCKLTWVKSAKNTLWCFLGCSLGNFSMIFFLHHIMPNASALVPLTLGPLAGLFTSISLESIVLMRQLGLREAVKVAFGMSFISMIVMQVISNISLFLLSGEINLTWWALIPSLIIGFLSVWPYNYYKIKNMAKNVINELRY